MSFSTVHGESESQTGHNRIMSCDFLTACWDIFGFGCRLVSLSHSYLHTTLQKVVNHIPPHNQQGVGAGSYAWLLQCIIEQPFQHTKKILNRRLLKQLKAQTQMLLNLFTFFSIIFQQVSLKKYLKLLHTDFKSDFLPSRQTDLSVLNHPPVNHPFSLFHISLPLCSRRYLRTSLI